MSKTPEELAEEYCCKINDVHSVKAACRLAYIAGFETGNERKFRDVVKDNYNERKLEEVTNQVEKLGKLSQQFIENYFGPEGGSFDEEVVAETSFIRGYKAAQEHAHAALEEAEARIQELQDQLADADKVMPQWISVKDRLPEIPENGYSNRVLLLRADGFIVIGKLEKCVRFVRPLQEALIVETDNGDPIEEFTHWQELPEPPKEEG